MPTSTGAEFCALVIPEETRIRTKRDSQHANVFGESISVSFSQLAKAIEGADRLLSCIQNLNQGIDLLPGGGYFRLWACPLPFRCDAAPDAHVRELSVPASPLCLGTRQCPRHIQSSLATKWKSPLARDEFVLVAWDVYRRLWIQ